MGLLHGRWPEAPEVSQQQREAERGWQSGALDAGLLAGGHPGSALYQPMTLSRRLKPLEPLSTVGECVAPQRGLRECPSGTLAGTGDTYPPGAVGQGRPHR